MQYYDNRHCVLPKDLYETFDIKKHVKIKRDLVQSKYGEHSKKGLCCKVLLYCFYLILLDIIENNATFVFPVRGRECVLHVVPCFDEDFLEAMQRGKFKGIDFLASNFTGYSLELRWQYAEGFRRKPVFINKTWKEKFYNYINSGKKYY